jgi:preprotein translocase SecE subunit
VSDDLATRAGQKNQEGQKPGRSRRGNAEGGFGLRIYKPGQGFYTRVGTAIGAGVLIVAGSYTLYDQITSALSRDSQYFYPTAYGITVGFLALAALAMYWVVGLNRKANDFFIATEGEMKKVNWSTRREVWRSTKVVITLVIIMSILLFAGDLLFMIFFSQIGVLKGVSVLELFGIG